MLRLDGNILEASAWPVPEAAPRGYVFLRRGPSVWTRWYCRWWALPYYRVRFVLIPMLGEWIGGEYTHEDMPWWKKAWRAGVLAPLTMLKSTLLGA